MKNYCTLFDSFYLSRGLAMYESLKSNSKAFHLYIFAFDDQSELILNTLSLSNTTIISLNDFETSELKEVKPYRTKAEYCWTCTPSTILYVIEKFQVNDCTYLDSDLMFFSDPAVLIDEMYNHNKSVLITEHRFSILPRIYEEKRAGRFCVQFVTFVNEMGSLSILDTWRRQCIEWCYSKYEDGKFGDQKYLDEWPLKYSNVHILINLGGGIAPWNSDQYIFREENDTIRGLYKKTRSDFKVVFYHFQYVKLLEDNKVDIGWYFVIAKCKKLFYRTYLDRILKIEKMLVNTFPGYVTGLTYFKADDFRNFLKIGFKKITGYNILKLHV